MDSSKPASRDLLAPPPSPASAPPGEDGFLPVPTVPARSPHDHPSSWDQFFFRPLPHVSVAAMLVGAGLALNSPITAVLGFLAVFVSNAWMARRLLYYFQQGYHHRFLMIADQMQATFPM